MEVPDLYRNEDIW